MDKVLLEKGKGPGSRTGLKVCRNYILYMSFLLSYYYCYISCYMLWVCTLISLCGLFSLLFCISITIFPNPSVTLRMMDNQLLKF